MLLHLEDDTIRSYLYLAGDKEVLLKAYITLSSSAKKIMNFIQEHFVVKYILAATSSILNRLHFIYQKFRLTPGKTNAKKGNSSHTHFASYSTGYDKSRFVSICSYILLSDLVA